MRELSAEERIEKLRAVAERIEAAQDIAALKAELLEVCKALIGEIQNNTGL